MSTNERIAAAVILYHPEENVIENIRSYYDFVDVLYVFDNTESSQDVHEEFQALPKVQYYHDNKNEGIATRLNAAANLAIESGYDWLLTMDQDTSFSREAIENYIACATGFQTKEHVAMFGTEYGKQPRRSTQECTALEEENLITSGALLNLKAYLTIGPFDENLFIDSVDHDYCIRAKLAGFSIIKLTNIYITHNLGDEVYRSSIKTLYLIKKRKIVHSPLRCYYMYRNMLYLEKKFAGKDAALMKRLRKIVTGNLKASMFYGREPVKTLRYIMKAKQHFVEMKMGKTDIPA